MRFVFLRTALCVSLAVLLLFSLLSCKKNDVPKTTETPYYTVTFDVGGAEPIADQVVPSGSFLYEPTMPRREGWVFGGWVEQYSGVWSFSEFAVERDMTLVATWLSAEAVFDFELIGDAEAVRIVGLKQTVKVLDVPATINGMPVREIGDEVFAELSVSKIAMIFLPDSITSVGEGAFRGAVGVKISFDENAALISVGEDAFLGCDGLSSVRLDERMTSLSAGCFSGTSLRSVQIPDRVTVIPENAFEGCRALVALTMGAGVTSVEDSAFYDCSALRAIYFYGTAVQFDWLIEQGISHRNDALLEATAYLYSETKPEGTGAYGFWYFDKDGTVKLW